MNVVNTLATVFTVLLFAVATVTVYDQINIPFFQQYKSIVFVGSMFVFLGIFGLPYIHYDVAHTAPSFTFVSTAIGIAGLLCALFVYMYNMQVDTYVGVVSAFVIFLTIAGRISGDGVASDAVPPFVKSLLQFVVAGSALFGTYKGAEYALTVGVPANPTVRLLLSYWTQLAPVGVWGIVVYAIYESIQGLLKYRLENRPCATMNGKDGVAPFEGFQEAVASTTATGTASARASTTLLTNLQAAIDRVQRTLEDLVELTDTTCAIVQEVEQGYVGARSAPEDEVEYKLPEAEQTRRRQSRQERAKKAFDTNRKVYAAMRETVPLECFLDLPSDISEYDLSLREHCIQLHTLLENAETQTQIRKLQSIEVDLDFADRQLNRAEAEAFQNPSSSSPSPTHIYSSLRGKELESAAKGLLAKELNLHNKVLQLQQKTKTVQGRMSRTYQKINMVAMGDYST